MDLLCFFCLVFAMPLCASVYMCLVVTCWERPDLSFVVSYCEFVTSHWYPGSGVALDCIDSCSLHPYLLMFYAHLMFIYFFSFLRGVELRIFIHPKCLGCVWFV